MTRNDELFDEWPEKYDQWFMTPLGSLIKRYEGELISELFEAESRRKDPGRRVRHGRLYSRYPLLGITGCGTRSLFAHASSGREKIQGIPLSFRMGRYFLPAL